MNLHAVLQYLCDTRLDRPSCSAVANVGFKLLLDACKVWALNLLVPDKCVPGTYKFETYRAKPQVFPNVRKSNGHTTHCFFEKHIGHTGAVPVRLESIKV